MPIASWGSTLGAIQRRQVYDAQVNGAYQTANPALAPAVVAHTNAMPWAAPQTGYALAAAGAQPGDPVSQAVSTAALNKKGGGFWHRIGQIVDAPLRAAIHLGSDLGGAVSDLQGAGKVAARTAFTAANSLYEVPMGAVRDVAAAGGDILGGAVSGLATGAAIGAAGFNPISIGAGALGGAVIGGIGGAVAQAKGVNVSGQFVNPLAQSAGTLAVGNLLSGNKVDLGTGFQPGGALSAEATRNMQTAASIDGHALTPGRMLASAVFSPGTGGYNLLSGMGDAITRWELDPGRYVGEEIGAQRQAAKVLPGVSQAIDESGAAAKAGPLTRLATRAGILDTADPNFNPDVARNFLTTDPAARNFVAKAAQTDSAWDIVQASNGKISSQLANELAANTTEQGVTDTLLNHMQNQGLREKAAVQTGGSWLGQTVSNLRPVAKMAPVFDRLSSIMPQHSVSLMDIDRPGGVAKLDNAVQQLRNVYQQARVPEEVQVPVLNKLMQATTADEAKATMQDGIHNVLRQHLVEQGASPEAIQNVLHTTVADRAALVSQLQGEVANAAPIKQVMIGGQLYPVGQAADMLADDATQVRLPDGRTLRQMTTPSDRMRQIYTSRAFQETSHAADFFMGKWKNLNVPRPALVTKFLGMSQAKMAANGLETPLSDVPTQVSMLLNRFTGTTRPAALEGLVDASPLSQSEELMSLSKRFAGGLSTDELTPHQQVMQLGDEGFAKGWGARLAELHADPVARAVSADGVEPTVMSMMDGPLQSERLRLAKDENLPELAGLEGVRQHVQTIADNMEALTANNPQLRDAIGTGHISHPDGTFTPLLGFDLDAAAKNVADQAATRLRARIASGGLAPAEETTGGVTDIDSQARDAANRAVKDALGDQRPGVRPTMTERLAPGGTGGGGPTFGGEYGAHPGIGATGPEPTLPTPPGTGTYKPPEARSGMPSAPVSKSPAELAYEREMAAAATNAERRAATERMYARYRGESGGTAATATPGYRGNAASMVGKAAPSVSAANLELIETARQAAYEQVQQTLKVAASKNGLVNPALETHLAGLLNDPAVETPSLMRGAKPDITDPDYGNKIGRVTNALYSTLGKAQDALTNHPAFNQLYWQGVAENAPNLDAAGRADLLERMGADNVRVPKATAGSIAATLDKSSLGALSANDVHELAKASAIQKLQDMTIDMSKKQGWQDSMRHIAPFAKHWQQEMTQWATILSTHPEAFEKANMAVNGGKGSGFFHKDSRGQLVFNYPGSGLVSKVLTGVDMPLTGKVSGLSAMTTDILPGAGPMVSLLASKVLPNKPEYDSIKNFLAPYGDPTNKGVLSAIEPTWAKTLQTALSDPEQDRDAGNTTMEVAKYLVSTGKYSLDTPDNINKTLDAAGARAKKLLELQALGKFVLPSSPALEPLVENGADHKIVTAKLLSDDLQAMRKANYDTSTQQFLNKYGDQALLFLQSATRPLVPGAASTKEESDFVRAHPDVKEKLPNLYAYFAPQGAQTPNYNSITDEIASGERQALTPKQQIALANNQVGSMVYYNQKAKMGTRISAPQQQWLDRLKQGLMQKYPGFNVPIVGLGARLSDDPQSVEKVVVPELQKALDDPKLSQTPTGKSVADYLQVRAAMDKAAQSRGLKPGTFATASKTADLRAVLRKAGDLISASDPGFSKMYDEVLSRELKTDTQSGATSATNA